MTALSSVYVMSMGGESPTLSDMGLMPVSRVAPDITIKFHLKNIGRRLNISEDFLSHKHQRGGTIILQILFMVNQKTLDTLPTDKS